MSLTNIAEGCVLNKEAVKEACEKIKWKDMEKYFLKAQLETSGLIEFYFRLQKEMSALNEIWPEKFVAIALTVINDLYREVDELSLSITYANAKYAGIGPLIPVIASIIFPPKFFNEVEKLLN